MNYLDHPLTVGSCDMDVWGRLKPTTILSICQETAYMHSTTYGFGFEQLLEKRAAWVLSRAEVQIERLPKWHDQITVRTWHKGASGIFSLRDYIFYDSDQRPIIRVSTSWLIINIASRRILRVGNIFGDDDGYERVIYPHHAIEREPQRVTMPLDEAITLGDHTVLYSDLDVNRHVNNTRYLEWACDHSPQQMIQERELEGFTINFNHEAKYGERVTLLGAAPVKDQMIIEGTAEGRSIFTVNLSYRSI